MSLIETIKPSKLHSFFMFPFQFSEKFSLEGLKKLIEENNTIWQYEDYQVKDGLRYNEYFYFYPHLRNILFSNREIDDMDMKRAFFRAKNIHSEKLEYTVILKDDVTYSLPLEQIYLHLFENRTGILVFEVVQLDQKYNLQQYLKFIDMGRRIYIPYLNQHKEIPSNIEKDELHSINLFDSILHQQCPKKIVIDRKHGLEHDFVTDFNFDKDKPESYGLSNIIRKLLDSGEFNFENEAYKSTIDDRMYTHTYYEIGDVKQSGNDLFLKQIREYFNKDNHSIEKINDAAKVWYQMIFIDSGNEPLCKNDQMLKELLDKATYKRWTESGSLFGFSRYSTSFVANWEVLRGHFESMYYQFALLNLFYRNSLLLFSDRTIKISENIKKSSAMNHLQKLQEDIILFENKYWFREISAQEQGIEMFDQWEKQYRNNILLQDVKQGILELYTYFDSQREKKNEKKLKLLTIIAGLFFPITIAIDIISNDLQNQSFIWKFINRCHFVNYGLGVSIVIFICIALYLLKQPIRTLINKIRKK